ncbi:MAG: sugar phosphate isomerase/epimerase [Halieaceae bacterium]|jgi:sugar phosphate isomerase/epimerase|nr:sugar phosphate isomerase/epimerase [Halieaceae bacterium]
MMSRRAFTAGVAAAGLALSAPLSGFAGARARPLGPLKRVVGLQLYTLREQVAADLDGTLEMIAGLGYGEVETAGFHGLGAGEFAERLLSHGLKSTAMHMSMTDLAADPGAAIDAALALGADYLVCSFPGAPDPSRLGSTPREIGGAILSGRLDLDEWRWNAEQLQRIGEAATAAGVSFAYHNHAMEFATYDGTVAFDEILRLTDARHVQLEVDCAWVFAGGRDPAEFIRTHQSRVRLLHIKDVDPDAETFRTVPVGTGAIDWPGVFAAVDPSRLDHYYVEQEHFDQAPLEAVAESIRYLTEAGSEAA